MGTGTPALSSDTSFRTAVGTVVFCSVAATLYAITDIEPAPFVQTLISYGPLLAVLIWIKKDSGRFGFAGVQDWGFFLWFAWPFLLPWYVLKTRGRRGCWLLLALLAMIVSSPIIGPIAQIIAAME